MYKKSLKNISITLIILLSLNNSVNALSAYEVEPKSKIQDPKIKLTMREKVKVLSKTLADSFTNFDFWYEDFYNSNFDVYKGSRYINNYCNLQEKAYLIREKQDIYDKIVKNAFRLSKEKLLQLVIRQSNISLELEFLRNLDVLQDTPFGDYKNKEGEIVNDFDKSIVSLVEVLKPAYKKFLKVNTLSANDIEILKVYVENFVEKYKENFNYYELNTRTQKYKVVNGRYHKDECLGGIAQIKAKYDSLRDNFKTLKEIKKSPLAKEFKRLVDTFDKFTKTAKSVADLSLYKNKLKKIYGFDPKKKYSFADSLKQIARKTFPGAEDQLNQIKNQYIDRNTKSSNLDKQIGAKLSDGISEESKSKFNLQKYLDSDLPSIEKYQAILDIQTIQEQISTQEAKKLAEFTRSEVSDVNVLSLVSNLQKSAEIARNINKICSQKEDSKPESESTWMYSSKKVHDKQCNN